MKVNTIARWCFLARFTTSSEEGEQMSAFVLRPSDLPAQAGGVERSFTFVTYCCSLPPLFFPKSSVTPTEEPTQTSDDGGLGEQVTEAPAVSSTSEVTTTETTAPMPVDES
ncbi:MAG: hypothetical protein AAB869_01935 [Patescibacteria group bacterium]